MIPAAAHNGAGAQAGHAVLAAVSTNAGNVSNSTGVVTRVELGADRLVHVPADTSLQSIHVSGRDLVIQLPDGSRILVVDGAIHPPHLVIGDVDVPVQNLAALLIDNEVQAAAGPPQSAGGNFAVPPGEIGPGFGISPLLPPNELSFGTTETRLLFPGVAGPPSVEIIVPGGPPLGVTDAVETVQEGGLPVIGSHGGDGTNATSGEIDFAAPEGPATLKIDGVAVTAVGQVIQGQHGVLTITSIAGDAVGYTYTLTGPTPNLSVADVFTTQVTDGIGRTATATLTIDPIHDHPTANPDVTSDGTLNFAPIAGNVITATGDTNHGGADVLGADRPTVVTGVAVGASAGSFTAVASGAAGTTITSSEGSLTIHADGSYTYTRAPGTPGGVTDTFTYQVTDQDGATSTTTLTIDVAANPPTLTVPAVGSAGTVVFEAGLPTGSDPGHGVTTTGTIGFTPGDGGDSFTINGKAASVGDTFTGAHGTLTITSIDTVHDTVGYSYTLTSADPSLGRAPTEPVDSFAVVLTDQDGNHVSGNLVISDVEDQPTAHADVATDGTGNFNPISGNVVTAAGDINAGGADTQGADRPVAVTGIAAGASPGSLTTVASGAAGTTITTSEGSLTIHSDGSYTYTRAPGTPDNVNDTFTYQITDADGSTSTTTLTIAVAGAPPTISVPGAGAAGTVVFEAGLPTGSNPGVGVSTTGTISFTPGDAPDAFTVNGKPASVGDSFAGAHGTLTITSIDTVHDTVGYSYTLTSADPSVGRPATEPVDSFTIGLSDEAGNHVNGLLVISDVEDHPTANPDVNSLTEGTSVSTTGATGVVANDVLGADTPDKVTGIASGTSTATPVSGGVGTAITTSLGTLTLQADGSYTYVAKANTGGGVDHFVYTLTDADGSTSTTTLNITVAGDTLAAKSDSVTVDEAGLPGGSHAGDGSNITSGATLAGDVSGGSGGDTFTLVSQTGAHGNVVLNADGTYTYTLTSADPGAGRPGTEQVDTFTYRVTDSDGNSVTNTVTVNDVEDHPTAHPDTNSLTEGTSVSTTGATGVVSNDVLGADTPDKVTGIAAGTSTVTPVSGGVGTAITTGLGTLTLQADGSYTYVAKPNTGGGVDHFVYTLTDADGSTSTTTLNITVAGDTLAAKSDSVTVDEAGLPGGSHAGDGSNITSGATLAGDVSGGSGGDTFTLVSQTGAHGHVLLNADGSYTYTLTSADTGAGRPGTEQVDTFTYRVTDSDGNSVTQTVVVNDVEDHPTANPDTNSLTEGTSVSTTGATGVVANDVLGADTPDKVTGITAGTSTATPVSGGVGTAISTSLGTLTLQADGSYTYVAKANTGGGVDHFVYTLTDADGSTSTTTLNITVANDTLAAKSDSVTVDEAGLPGGSHAGNGSNITSGATLAGDVSGGSGGDTFTLVSQTGAHGKVVLNADGTYTYTLTSADPGAGRPGAEQVDTFTYKVTDSNGNSVTQTVVVNDVEDHPTANPDTNILTEGSQVSTTGATGVVSNDVLGADTPDKVTGIAAGTSTATPVSGGVGTAITTSLGTLTLQADGSYTYVAKPGTAGQVDHFVYTLTDADGSTSTTTLTINIASSNLAAHGATVTVDEAGLLTGSSAGDGSNIVSGSLTANVTGGSGGDTFTLVSQTGVHGNVVVSANGDFTYTLGSADPGAGRPATEQVDTFTYKVTDSHGDTSTNTVVVNDVEDHPTANPDTNSVGEGTSVSTTIATGVVANDVLGADTPDKVTGIAAGTSTATPVSGGVGTAITTSLGTLTLQADGSYTYAAKAGTGGGVDHFVYTLTDADGSTSTTTLNITVSNDTLAAKADSVTVDEAGLPAGSAAGNGSNIAHATLTGDVSGGSGGDTFTLVSQTGVHGSVVLNANGTYTYTLAHADPGLGRPATEQVDSFTYKVTDSHGNSVTQTVVVNDVEDHPTADPDTNSLTEGTSVSTTAATGVVVNDVLGADTPDKVTGIISGTSTATPIVGGVGTAITTSLGTLTLQADGSYTYIAKANTGGGVDHFVYTLTDADGSTSTTTLNITVAGDNIAAKADSVTVNEAGLPAGSLHDGSNATSGATLTGDVSGGAGGDTFTLVADNTHNGNLVLNSNGTYSFTLTSPVLAGGAESAGTFTYKVTDSDGNSATNTVTINVLDDHPIAAPDTNSLIEGTQVSTTAATGVVSNDVLGADTPDKVTGIASGTSTATPVSGGVGTAITTSLGTLTLQADGSYTYVAKANTGGGVDHFVYTLTDADGSTSTTTLNITVGKDNIAANADTITVNEAGLPTGSLHDGSNATSATLTGDVSGGSGGDTFSLVANNTHDGTLVLNSNGTYSFTLTSPVTGGAGETAGTFTYKVTDSQGNSATNTVTVDVIDDKPTIAPDSTSTADDPKLAPIVATGNLHLIPGADTPVSITDISDTGDDNGGSPGVVTSGGVALVYTTVGDTLTATAGVGGPTVFTLTENPAAPGAAPGTGTYTFTLDQAIDGPFVPTSSFSSGGFGAGPSTDGQQLTDNNSGGKPIALLAGFNTSAGFSLGTSTDISGAHPDATVGGVNGATPGFGIDSNNFTHDQLFVLEFQQLTKFTGAGYDPASTFTGASVNATTLEFTKATTGEYQVHFVDGSVGAVTSFTNATSIDIAPGKDILYIEVLNTGNSNGKFSLGTAAAEQEVANAQLNFSTTVTDADGSTSTGTFHVTVSGPVSPIVLDLNGDGVKFVGEDAGVTFNYGSGLVATAWAAAGDGVLALDTGHGLIANFASSTSQTDLQGLAAYDTNHDGKLDAGDAAFSKFGAIVDGKFETLTQLGVKSINLASDNHPYSAAGGQVQVAGTGTFTFANGKTGSFADASFATGPLANVATQSEAAANESASLVAASAAAAAGVLAASLGLGPLHSLTPGPSFTEINGLATLHPDDIQQIGAQTLLGAADAMSGAHALAPTAATAHLVSPTMSPMAGGIDLSALSGLGAPGSQLGHLMGGEVTHLSMADAPAGGGEVSHFSMADTPVVSSHVTQLGMAVAPASGEVTHHSLADAPVAVEVTHRSLTDAPVSGAEVTHHSLADAPVGGFEVSRLSLADAPAPTSQVAKVLADALPGAHDGGGSLASLIEGLPTVGQVSPPLTVHVDGTTAVFHAAIMGPGFGAFEFGNEMATLTHHSFAVAAHA